MSNRFGKVLLVPGKNGTTEDVRALLRRHDVDFDEVSETEAAEFSGLHRPAIVLGGRPYEGVSEISGALNYHLRF